jgi:ABC-type lipoprotein export system ATPase subunit
VEPTIKVEGLTKSFKMKSGDVLAVDSVDLAGSSNELIAIVGPSGSGKTTLLYLLGSLERCDAGRIEVSGIDIESADIDLIEYRRNKIGFVFQFFNLLSSLTVIENVILPMDINGTSSREQKERASELLEKMGIGKQLQRSRPNKMSGGEKQRVAIARALANNPGIILADEPTGNLDSATGRNVIEILVSLAHDDGKCVVVVTHDESVLDIADSAFQMHDGRIEKVK